MSFNFPNSPTVGQLWPVPAVPGTPQYIWDGTSWNSNVTSSVEALALNGMQVNGDMRISQELGVGGSRTTSGYLVDGWGFSFASAAAMTAAQFNAATVGVPGLSSLIYISVTTASTTPAAGDFVTFYHVIEGYRFARAAFGTSVAQPVTIAFWTGHHRTGTYSLVLRNGASNRAYATTYTQNVADVYEYKTITIPGDIVGTWTTDNTAGATILFAMVCGTTYTAPTANAWNAGNYIAAPGQVNGVGATTDAFRLTGVIVMPGSVAPSQANQPFCFRPYDQELMLCQRYLYMFGSAEGVTARQRAGGDTYRFVGGPFPVIMRAGPTMTVTGIVNYAGGQIAPSLGTTAGIHNWECGHNLGDTTSIYVVQNLKADTRL